MIVVFLCCDKYTMCNQYHLYCITNYALKCTTYEAHINVILPKCNNAVLINPTFLKWMTHITILLQILNL